MLVFYLGLLETNGDKELFAQIYAEYNGRIYGIAFKILSSQALAEDVTHEVFLKIINNFAKFKAMEPSYRQGWINVVTRNAAIDVLRKEKRSELVEDAFVFDIMENRRWQSSPLDLVEYINSLPEKYIDVLQLYYFSGYRASEIADMLGLKTNTVEQQLSRARKMLKEMILADQAGVGSYG